MANDEKPKDSPKDEPRDDTVPERITFWASLLIVVALFAFLGIHAWRAASPGSANAAPHVTATVELKKARSTAASHWAVPITIHNAGNLALEEVQIRVFLLDKDGKKQNVDLSFAYLAEGATEDAFIVTETPPAQAKPEATVTAFKTQRRARGY